MCRIHCHIHVGVGYLSYPIHLWVPQCHTSVSPIATKTQHPIRPISVNLNKWNNRFVDVVLPTCCCCYFIARARAQEEDEKKHNSNTYPICIILSAHMQRTFQSHIGELPSFHSRTHSLTYALRRWTAVVYPKWKKKHISICTVKCHKMGMKYMIN